MMFKKAVLSIFGLACSLALSAQEVHLKNPLMWTSGCSGNAIAQFTKKTKFTFEGSKLHMKMISKMCTRTREFNLEEMQGLTLSDNVDKVYYDQKSKMGVVAAKEDGFFLFFTKKDSDYIFFDMGTAKKGALKKRKLKNEKGEYEKVLSGIDDALESAKKAEEAALAKQKEEEEAKEAAAQEAAMLTKQGPLYKENVGKVLFSEQRLGLKDKTSDSYDRMTTEIELGKSVFFVRAYYPTKIGHVGDMVLSMGGERISLIELMLAGGDDQSYTYHPSHCRSIIRDRSGLVGTYALISNWKDNYFRANDWADHNVVENAFRILLSRLGDKLKVGTKHKLKIEMYNRTLTGFTKVKEGKLVASGEVTVKITKNSQNILSKLCRCSKPQSGFETVKTDIKKLFSEDESVKKVLKVSITDKDYQIKTQYGRPVHRYMNADVFYLDKDGVHMFWKGSVKYAYDGSKYSKIAQFNGAVMHLPTSPTCIK